MGKLIDGKRLAADVLAEVTDRTAALLAQGVTPGLATVLVGEDPASAVYVRSKQRAAAACGFASFHHQLPAETDEGTLRQLVMRLNADTAVHGILVQMPLPRQIDAGRIMATISPAKDVDGFNPVNAGHVALGQLRDAFVPCTPLGCMRLIRSVLGEDLAGLTAVVLGRSQIVGRPMAQLLLAADCTVTIAHSRSRDLAAVARTADILVAAVGKPGLVTADWIKPGAVVIDVGINRIAGPDGKNQLVGDVVTDQVLEVAAAVTPVPGGVGPMTIAMLMANTAKAAARTAGLD